MDWFPHPGRDNGGKEFSPLELDVTLRPHPRFWLNNRSAFDPTEHMQLERNDTGATVVPVPDVLQVTFGERFTRDESSTVYTLCSLGLSRRYLLDLYYAYDFQLGRQARTEVRITRITHEWAFQFVYGFDPGQGNNQSFTVNVEPVWLLEDVRRRLDRTLVRGR